MSDIKNIIGKWSIDIMYGPGGQEDTFVVFFDDGFGWIEFINYACREIETFNWEVINGKLINIVGLDSYDEDGHNKSTLNFTNLGCEIKHEITPSGIEMDTLTFSEPIWGYENKFGIFTRDLKGIERTFENV